MNEIYMSTGNSGPQNQYLVKEMQVFISLKGTHVCIKTSYFDYGYTYSYVHISFVESKEGCGLATMDRCYDATAVEGSVQTDLYEVIIYIILKLSIL